MSPSRLASRACFLTASLLAAPCPAAGQSLSIGPTRFDITVDADTVISGGVGVVIGTSPMGGIARKFRANPSATNVPSGGPRFLIVSPARGTTPAAGAIALDPAVVPFLAPGVYSATYSYSADEPGATDGAGGFFTLRINRPPPPAIDAVVNSASLRPVLAPGAAISIFGSHLGSPAYDAKYDEFGMFPRELGNSAVTFNGVSAALTYVSPVQINAIVPREVAGEGSARVEVIHHGQKSGETVVGLRDVAPGIYTRSQSGNGPGAILQTPRIVGFPVTLNSEENPVEKGGTIVLYATGAGLWNQDVESGQVLFVPQSSTLPIRPRAPVNVKIGGIPARILYAGAAPGKAGAVQVNAIVPEEVASGVQSIELMVGSASNAPQDVTVAIR